MIATAGKTSKKAYRNSADARKTTGKPIPPGPGRKVKAVCRMGRGVAFSLPT
jgi:hypothetical protein